MANWMTQEHTMLAEMTSQFFANEWKTKLPKWREQGQVDR